MAWDEGERYLATSDGAEATIWSALAPSMLMPYHRLFLCSRLLNFLMAQQSMAWHDCR